MSNFVHEHALHFMRRTAATEDGALASIKGACMKQDLPSITPEAGRFLQTLMLAIKARRVLEIGTCLGYSTVWLARGVADAGIVETIEIDKQRASEAAANFQRAGVQDKVRILEGKALGVIPTLPTKAYDAVFIDADKENMPEYLKLGVKLLRHGGVLLADNVFWHGSVFSDLGHIEGSAEVKEFVRQAVSHPELESSILPLGDGLLFAVRR